MSLAQAHDHGPHHDHSAHVHEHHDGGHEHAHSGGHHGHSHAPASYDRAFAVGVTLNLVLVGLQVVFGLFSGSLALLADAGHNLGDVLSLLLAWSATILLRRVPTARRTYGWRRFSILAALINAITLLAVVVLVAWEAVHRLMNPTPVEGGVMIIIAALAVLMNAVAAVLFLRGRERDMNIRAAFLHLASDSLVSVGVVAAGLGIVVTGWLWLDPAVSLGISLAIVLGTWGLLRDSLNLALDAVPAGIDESQVRRCLETLPGVVGVHDLHIWGMSTMHTALTAHLVTSEVTRGDRLLTFAATELREQFAIEHATLQLEVGDAEFPCRVEATHQI